MADPSAAPSTSTSAPTLTDHQLARLAAAVRPLAAVNTAAGARSLFRDPREPNVHGAPPETTPLEHGCDSGLVHGARVAWQRWVQLPAEVRATLMWLAEHEGPTLNLADAASDLADARRPALSTEALRLALQRSMAHDLEGAIRRQARKVRSHDIAQALDTAIREHAAAAAAHDDACDARKSFGLGLLTSAYSAWFSGHFDPT